MRKLATILLPLAIAACGDDSTGDDGSVMTATDTPTTTAMSTSGEPTTDEPTTDEPTTDEPTTDEPTTAEPTTTPGTESGGGGVCTHTCGGDQDCTIGGSDIGLVCGDDSACTHDCASDDDCTSLFNEASWAAVPCTAGGGECDALMYICVDLGDGMAGCAPDGSAGCMAPLSELEVTDIDGNAATTCGIAGRCLTDSGICGLACEGDEDCTAPATCNDQGACEAEGGGGGCENDDECQNPFDGGTVTCE